MRDYLKNLFAARGAAFWLNLLGLSLAFVIFYVLMAEVMWHVTYDRFHKDADRVYQVFYKNEDVTKQRKKVDASWDERVATFSGFILKEILDNTQQFESAFCLFHAVAQSSKLSPIDTEGKEIQPVNTAIWHCTDDLFKVFTFDIIEGDTALFHDSNNVFIPLSLAHKLFGEEGPYVGRKCMGDSFGEVSIGGVYRDFPTNSQITNDVYQLASQELQDRHWNDKDNTTDMLFVKLRKGANGKEVSDELMANSAELREWADSYEFVPLHDVYFMQDVSYKTGPFVPYSITRFGKRNGNFTLAWVLGLVSMLVLFIAAINYINFSMAMVPYQVKEINIRRVFGAQKFSLRWNLMQKAIANVLAAAVLSLLPIYVIVQHNLFADWLNADLAFEQNGYTLLLMLGVVILLPLMAGGYPAWYVTSRKPAMVINGNFALSTTGRALRRGLIAFQFTLSMIVLLTLTLFLSQTYYLYNASVGYDRDLILTAEIPEEYSQEIRRQTMTYINPMIKALRENPAIKEASWSNFPLGTELFGGHGRICNGDTIRFDAQIVDYNYLNTVGFKLTDGRNFTPEDHNGMIFNETARRKFGLKIGDVFYEPRYSFETDEQGNLITKPEKPVEFGRIIGFMEDAHYKDFRSEVAPMACRLANNFLVRYIVVRLASPEQKEEVIRFMEEQNQMISDGRCKLVYHTGDDLVSQTYVKDLKYLELLTYGAIFTFLIPLIGVFGLVLFETRAKRKEIGIRKVFGATTRGILVMFNMQYLRTLMVCFILAAPVAYTLYNRWIESFAYRTPMHWWLFAVAFLVVAIVVCLTVTIQSWRAAKERPVETIMK